MVCLFFGVKVDGNPWERRSKARHFCNLAFPGLKERFSPWDRTLPERKASFIHGSARSCRGRSELVSLNLVKITA